MFRTVSSIKVEHTNGTIEDISLPEDIGKGAEASVQDITNEFTKKIDDLISAKEADIITV